MKPSFDPSARWIWDGGPAQPVDTYRLFRKTFTAGRIPRSAALQITADREYRLFINGAYVARGPAPNPPKNISVDRIDIAPYLKQGDNVLGVIVYHLGVLSFPRVLGRAGLLAQLDLAGRPIVTDASWKWRDAWWVPTGEKFSVFREFTENLDGRWEHEAWNRPEYDDSEWKSAGVIGPVGVEPWTEPELRDIPMPEHHAVDAKRLLFLTTCDNFPPLKKDAAAQLAAEPRRAGNPPVKNIAGLTDPNHPAAEILANDVGVVIGLDFGREVSGFPEIEAESDADGIVIDAGYGEALEKDGHVSVRRQGNPDADRFVLRRGKQTLRVFNHRAFRYMVLAVRGGNVRFKPIRVVESGYPVQMRGAFTCSDGRLNEIWEVGRHTMRICMDQGFMDCPWRERGQYIGDGLAELPVALYAFGDTALMRRFLRQGKLTQPPDGMLTPAYPSDWIPWHKERGPWRIPGYGALWVVMLEEFFRMTRDIDLMRELSQTTDRLLNWFAPHVGPDGMLKSIPEWNFIDWAKLDPKSALACLNLQYLMALRAGTQISASLAGLGEASTTAINQLAASFESAHWDDSRGLYRDAPGIYSVHANALALLTLVKDPAKAKRVLDGMKAPDLVQVASPYFDGFVLRALCKHGRQEDAVKMVRDKWGPMIDAGATTFWESYAGEWSMCHAWSCTPTALLSEEVLGVTYDAVRKTARFAPNPVGLTWAQGIAPLACGDITARWEIKNGVMDAKLSTPRGIQLVVDMPAKEAAEITINGKKQAIRSQNGRFREILPGGDYNLATPQP